MVALMHSSVSLPTGTWIEMYPGQCIRRDGQTTWPARLPNLNPMDSYLLGHLKSLGVFVFSTWFGNSTKSNCDKFSDNKNMEEFWIVFGWQWNIELRPVFRQQVSVSQTI
jgi:hypothetical protein